MQDRYFLTWDGKAIAVTVLCLLITIVIAYLSVKTDGWQRWILVFCAMTTLLVPACLCPLFVSRDSSSITIYYAFHRKELSLKKYTIEQLKDFSFRNYQRVCASDGYFGYWGKWKVKGERVMVNSCLTNTSKNVYILRPNTDDAEDIWLVNLP